MEIAFYHLTSSPLERALPLLLEKGYEAGMRSLVVADKDKVKFIDDTLWTSYQRKFLPHGTTRPEVQPIFITGEIANDNNREVLVITNGLLLPSPLSGGSEGGASPGFKKLLDIFNGNLENELGEARKRWKSYKDAGYEPKYWFQDESGKWEQKS